MPWAILDTNVYIGHWERGLYEKELARIRKGFIIRHSAVVLSELRRGARAGSAQRVVEELADKAHIQWEPTSQDWWQARLPQLWRPDGIVRAPPHSPPH